VAGPGGAVVCLGLHNGLGREVASPGGLSRGSVYDLSTFRHVPPADMAVELLRRFFFNRTDFVCHFARWEAPCPARSGNNLDAVLRAHCYGRRAARARLRWVSKKHPEGGDVNGWFRIGTYGPAPDGTTRWLVIDFDGGGEHSAPLAEPMAVALSVLHLCYRAGLHAYLERSYSGKGWHLWVFFDTPVPARKARQLGFALAPRDAWLADGDLADPESGTGIEVYPKCDSLREGGRGNQVWLPWYFASKGGCNVFYGRNPRGFEPFVPLDLDTVTEAKVDRAIERLGQIDAEEGADG
jgi:hypothetical protein